MVTTKNFLIALSLIIALFSCSKDEDEIPLADPGISSSDFDSGYLGIRLEGSSSMVDSIIYTNTTKGFSFVLPPSQIIFIQGSNTGGLLSKPLLNGNTGDQIRCCVYINTLTEAGISYTNVNDIPLDTVLVGAFCVDGIY